MTTPPPPAPGRDVAARRLVGTLATAGAVAGLAIVLVFRGTQPTIQRYQAAQLQLAVQEVLHQPDRYETLWVLDGTLARARPTDGGEERVFLGFRDGRPVGFAVETAEPGFQDVIRLIFGYDPSAGEILGMKVLESRETPGLGDKIEKDSGFVRQFEGAAVPLRGVNARTASGAAGEIDLITGATISSRTLIRAINQTLARLGPVLDPSVVSRR